MKYKTVSLALLALYGVLSGAAQAHSAIYDFTGTVTQASGIYASIPIGATVTGTYTFELSNANPAQSSGTIGSTSSWGAELFGGSYYVTAPTPVSSRSDVKRRISGAA